MEKGQIFSIDGMLTITIILFIFMIFSLNLNMNSNQLVNNLKNFYLEEKTIFVTDSFIKNYNPNPIIGSAIVDLDKKRTVSNFLDSKNFILFKKLELNDFFIKEIKVNVNKIYFDNENLDNSCLSVKRFVLVDGKKEFVTIQGCLK